MTFKKESIPEFMDIFSLSCQKIRQFEGCHYLKLLQNKKDQRIIITLSHWESESHLENYRNSSLFKNTWQQTKILFADKPEAWTLSGIKELP